MVGWHHQLNIHESESCSVVSNLLQAQGLYSPYNSPGQNTGLGLLFPSPGHLPDPGIEPRSSALQVDSLPSEPPEKPHMDPGVIFNLIQ